MKRNIQNEMHYLKNLEMYIQEKRLLLREIIKRYLKKRLFLFDVQELMLKKNWNSTSFLKG